MSPCECDWGRCTGDGVIRCRGCATEDGQDETRCNCPRHPDGYRVCRCDACDTYDTREP